MSEMILKSQVMADLAIQLSTVTPVDRAFNLVRQAFRTTGLSNTPLLTGQDVDSLLQAIAAEGGLVESIAQQIATDGLETYISNTRSA